MLSDLHLLVHSMTKDCSHVFNVIFIIFVTNIPNSFLA